MATQQKNLYRPFIFLLLASFLIFSGWSAWQAADLGSQVTDRDYYSKGLKYNSTLVEKRAAEVLGWTLATKLVGHSLTLSVADNKEANVTNAEGTIILYLPEAPKGRAFELHETSPGNYYIDLPKSIDGSIRARVTFERDGAKLNRQLQLNL